MVKPMVHSRKHFVQISLLAIASGALSRITLSVAVAPEDVNAAAEVEEGSTIKAVYLELWATGDDVVQGTGIFTMEKFPSGHVAPTTANMAALMDYNNKKNILETHMGLVPPNTSNPVNIFRHWIKIPKGKQRQGLGDLIAVTAFGQSDGLFLCGFATYKEYY